MAVELTAQELACDVDEDGHRLRGPDRGAAAHLIVRLLRGGISVECVAIPSDRRSVARGLSDVLG